MEKFFKLRTFERSAIVTKTRHFYIKPHAVTPKLAGIIALLMSCITGFTLVTIPSYTKYADYWIMLFSGILLCIFAFTQVEQRPALLIIPTGGIALAGCFGMNMLHGIEAGLFFLLFIILFFRLPAWWKWIIRSVGILLLIIGTGYAVIPLFRRIMMLIQSGHATNSYIIPLIIRTVGSDVFCMLSILLLIFAFSPRKLPYLMEDADMEDAIWE